MAETLLLTEEEKKEILAMSETDIKILSKIAESVSVIIRGVEGKPLDPTDFITKFTKVQNILERSRYPTYPLLNKQEYLRLIDHVHPEAKICMKWSDLESEALISYKGKSREENVEISKRALGGETQQLIFGAKYGEPTKKKRFWQRARKEESEFVNE